MLYAAVCATLVGGSVHTKGLLQKHIDHDTSDAGGVDVALKESGDGENPCLGQCVGGNYFECVPDVPDGTFKCTCNEGYSGGDCNTAEDGENNTDKEGDATVQDSHLQTSDDNIDEIDENKTKKDDEKLVKVDENQGGEATVQENVDLSDGRHKLVKVLPVNKNKVGDEDGEEDGENLSSQHQGKESKTTEDLKKVGDEPCPLGYSKKEGAADGETHMYPPMEVLTDEECAEECNREKGCNSFMYSSSMKECELYSETDPTSKKGREGFVFCSKNATEEGGDEGEDFDDEEKEEQQQEEEEEEEEEEDDGVTDDGTGCKEGYRISGHLKCELCPDGKNIAPAAFSDPIVVVGQEDCKGCRSTHFESGPNVCTPNGGPQFYTTPSFSWTGKTLGMISPTYRKTAEGCNENFYETDKRTCTRCATSRPFSWPTPFQKKFDTEKAEATCTHSLLELADDGQRCSTVCRASANSETESLCKTPGRYIGNSWKSYRCKPRCAKGFSVATGYIRRKGSHREEARKANNELECSSLCTNLAFCNSYMYGWSNRKKKDECFLYPERESSGVSPYEGWKLCAKEANEGKDSCDANDLSDNPCKSTDFMHCSKKSEETESTCFACQAGHRLESGKCIPECSNFTISECTKNRSCTWNSKTGDCLNNCDSKHKDQCTENRGCRLTKDEICMVYDEWNKTHVSKCRFPKTWGPFQFVMAKSHMRKKRTCNDFVSEGFCLKNPNEAKRCCSHACDEFEVAVDAMLRKYEPRVKDMRSHDEDKRLIFTGKLGAEVGEYKSKGLEEHRRLLAALKKSIREQYRHTFAFKRKFERSQSEMARMERHAEMLMQTIQAEIVEGELSETLNKVSKNKSYRTGSQHEAREFAEKLKFNRGGRLDNLQKEGKLTVNLIHGQINALRKMANNFRAKSTFTRTLKFNGQWGLHRVGPKEGQKLYCDFFTKSGRLAFNAQRVATYIPRKLVRGAVWSGKYIPKAAGKYGLEKVGLDKWARKKWGWKN